MASFSDIRIILLKLVMASISVLLFFGCFTKLQDEGLYYEMGLILTYDLAISIIIIFTEFSPYVLDYFLVVAFPFLSTVKGKSVFYIITGSFLFDPALNNFCFISGCSLVAAGLLWMLNDLIT
mmetsp:Transcript_6014/g.5426  ORF Transcript_6014/g.5426 Transcript_6014/m.5426 type:complete len:123 (+) Transcript_6014:4-372(+)